VRSAFGVLSFVSRSCKRERRVRLLKNAQNQAVRIPRGWELAGEEAPMRKAGSRLIIEPAGPRSLVELLYSWEDDLGEDEAFPEIDDPAPAPADI
jgi:antitoxin VapB